MFYQNRFLCHPLVCALPCLSVEMIFSFPLITFLHASRGNAAPNCCTVTCTKLKANYAIKYKNSQENRVTSFLSLSSNVLFSQQPKYTC